jgi:hypothetical protein
MKSRRLIRLPWGQLAYVDTTQVGTGFGSSLMSALGHKATLRLEHLLPFIVLRGFSQPSRFARLAHLLAPL